MASRRSDAHIDAAVRISSADRGSKSEPLTPSCTDSPAPPTRFAMTGVPAAIASTATMPKSSIGGKAKSRALSMSARTIASLGVMSSSTGTLDLRPWPGVRPRAARSRRSRRGVEQLADADDRVELLVGDEARHPQHERARAGRPGFASRHPSASSATARLDLRHIHRRMDDLGVTAPGAPTRSATNALLAAMDVAPCAARRSSARSGGPARRAGEVARRDRPSRAPRGSAPECAT